MNKNDRTIKDQKTFYEKVNANDKYEKVNAIIQKTFKRIISEQERSYMKEIWLMTQDCSSRDIQKVYISQGKRKFMPSQVTISKYINEFIDDLGFSLNTDRNKARFNKMRRNNLMSFLGKTYKSPTINTINFSNDK